MKTGMKILEMMMWPAMDYGGELAVLSKKQVDSIEIVQNAAARQLLGAHQRIPGVILRGELGWWTMEARRMCSQLRYFHRLQSMPEDRLVRDVFVERMASAMETDSKSRSKGKTTRANNKRRSAHGFCT